MSTSPLTPPSPSIPSRDDNTLIVNYVYDDAGRLWKMTDPKGIESRTLYDALGRTVATIEAHEDGVVESAEADRDRITRYTYDGNNNVLTLTAALASNDQTTTYAYGVTTAGGSAINSNDLLASVTYPDDGNGATSETETFAYNAVGQTAGKQDRNGTTHAYGYDARGRQTNDTVEVLGAGVDGAIRRLGFTYNSQGLPWQFTSYSNVSGTNVVNQVEREFNGLGS